MDTKNYTTKSVGGEVIINDFTDQCTIINTGHVIDKTRTWMKRIISVYKTSWKSMKTVGGVAFQTELISFHT